MCFYVGTLFRIKIFIKNKIVFSIICATLGKSIQKKNNKNQGQVFIVTKKKMPILATSLVTIKYPIMYLILYTIMQVSLPYCLVEVKI